MIHTFGKIGTKNKTKGLKTLYTDKRIQSFMADFSKIKALLTRLLLIGLRVIRD